MELRIIFWLTLLASWFIYILPANALKSVLLALSPIVMFILGIVDVEASYLFAGVILALSHARYFLRRYGPKRVERILKRTWVLLIAVQALLYVIPALHQTNSNWFLTAVAFLWLVAASKVLITTAFRNIANRYKPVPSLTDDLENLPTVTLAIPARNETHVLTDCLRSAVSSDYPKLEVIVLDDCSGDSTPQIIKSFAHDGVRFVSGKAPATGWIGKNQAYQTLLEQSSGDIIVFAGVDVRFEPDSISRLVQTFVARGSVMVTVMPYRRRFDLLPSITRTLRYYWQLALAKQPVMNSSWAVDRNWLLANGGFKPFKHAILPEAKLAKLADSGRGYHFVLSTPALGIHSRKRASSQFETAVRTLYPQSAKDPLLAIIWALVWLAVAGLWVYSWFVPVPAFKIGAVFFLSSYLLTEICLQPRWWLLSGLMLPFSLISQAVLSVVSMSAYEFGRVDWKGRNICLPAMNQIGRGAIYPPKSRQPT